MLEPDVSKTEALLRKHMESQNFRGIRMSIAHDPTDKQLPHAPEPDITKNPNFLANLELFRPSKLDLEYDLWVSPFEMRYAGRATHPPRLLALQAYGHQLPSLVELAKKFPDVRFILNHYSTPLYIGNDDAAFEEWKTNIKALADASPNVYAKLSGLMAMLGLDFGIYKQTWPNAGPSAETIASSRFGEMTKHVIESFGTDRCVFGSNFPVDKGMARYGELLASFVINAKEAGAGKEELKKMFHDNAKRFYRIECC